MGLLNPNSPTYRGLEPRCRSSRSRQISLGSGVAQRVRPGGATVYGFDAFCDTWSPSSGGLAFEVLTQLVPSNVTTLRNYPAADVYGTGGDWQRSTGAGTWFSHIDDDGVLGDFLFCLGSSVGAVVSTIGFRGNAGSLAGKRILSVSVKSYLSGGNPDALRFLLRIGGVEYSSGVSNPSAGLGDWQLCQAKWTLNPVTGVPWTAADVDAICTAAGADAFGFGGYPHIVQLYVASLWCEVVYCDENRVLSAYPTSPGTGPGWVGSLGAGGGVALSNNTWYWAAMYGMGNVASMPILSYPETLEAAAASDTTKEHRKVYDLVVTDGGRILTVTASVGEYAPLNLWAANTGNTLNASAWPFAECDPISIYTASPAANLGQEITCTAAQTYGGVKLGLGWQSPTVRPDAPLIIEVRTTSFTGTVQCTATIDPDDIVHGAGLDWQQAFDVTVTPGAAKVFVTLRSDATNGKGWRVYALDTRSDLKFSTMAQAASHFEAESMNGTTDAASLASSTRDTRYDLSIALVQAPAFAGSLTATPAVAA